MPRGSDVRDPFSLGLISFMGHRGIEKIGKTAMIRAHNVDAKVSATLWDTVLHKYDAAALSHKRHQRHGNDHMSKCKSKWKHNCLIDTDGTHLDTCIEYTQFYNI